VVGRDIMEYSPKKMKELLEKNGFSLKKKFGQNFIIDENVINSIIDKSKIDKDTLVIEVGPGAGSLTYKLGISAKNVICYEIDTTLENVLKENTRDLNNVKIIYQDFLKANVLDDIKGYEYKKLYFVANLPYYITTPIIIKIIEDCIPVDKMVFMVQKEVGNRFKALPGSKEYGSLSVYLNYYFDVKKILDISRHVFMPEPNVDSIIVEFSKKENLLAVKNEEVFFKLIRDSFTQKRKTLRNNLKGYDLEKIEEVLNRHKLDLSVRAEQLSTEIFIEIANNL
jgi:16S rRNA (adenine1518-N6/adenine1519-N6)-dimethyltransferase